MGAYPEIVFLYKVTETLKLISKLPDIVQCDTMGCVAKGTSFDVKRYTLMLYALLYLSILSVLCRFAAVTFRNLLSLVSSSFNPARVFYGYGPGRRTVF